MYICETCGKNFGHRGDFIKHVEVRKSPCLKDTKSQALIDRLAAMEKAMNSMAEAAGIKLNVDIPIQQTENMSFPLSKIAFDEAINTATDIQVGKDVAAKDLYKSDIPFEGYFKYLKDFITANNLNTKYDEAGVKKLRRHADLDDIIKLYSVYDVMKSLPAGAKIAAKQTMLADYFAGKFNKNTEEQVDNIVAIVPKEKEEVVILPTDSKEAAALKTMFARFEQMLYNEGTVGMKAREDIIDLMILRMLEPYFENKTIDILDIVKYSYDDIEINQNNIKYVMLSNLSKLKTEEIRSELRRIWTNVLCIHPLTRQIFSKEKFLNIKSDSGLSTMISDLCSFNFENCPIDILGNVYEHFIHKQFKGEQGSKLGQHFTPRKIVQFMVDNYSYGFDGSDKFIDPFSGTGGFVMGFYDRLKNIDQRSADDYLYASEIDPDVFKYAKANSLIYTKKICPHIIRTNAFEPENKNTRFERILTNPPFGMKFTDKDSYSKTTWFNQAKIKNGNMVCLQYNMHILAPGGICSMVWPYGSECFSTSKKTEIEIRKRLFTEFDVLSVILLPKGTFEYTSIATVIITFRKPIQGEIIVPRLKIYQYKDGAKTVDELEILADVGSDKLREKKFVIDPNAYKEMVNINNIRPVFEIKKLGDVCEIITGTNITKTDLKDGTYPVISGGIKNMGFHSEYNTEENQIIMIRKGSAGHVFMQKSKSFVTADAYRINPIGINKMYLYYMLKYHLQDTIMDSKVGVAQPGMSKEVVREINAPIPPIEIQNEIVNIVERFEAGISAMQESIKGIEFQIEMLSKKQFVFKEGEFEMKKIKDITEFMPTNKIKTSEGLSEGTHRFYNSSQEKRLFTNNPTVDKESVIIGNGGNVNIHYDIKFTPSKHVTVCNAKNDANINMKYLYYYLSFNRKMLEDLSNGVALKWINKESLGNIDVMVPPIEIQKQFIEYCVGKDNAINQKRQNIELIKDMINDIKLSIKQQFE